MRARATPAGQACERLSGCGAVERQARRKRIGGPAWLVPVFLVEPIRAPAPREQRPERQRQPCSTDDTPCHNRLKPKGPVCSNAVGIVVAAPTDKRGFVVSEFVCHGFPMAAWLWADGPTRKDGRTAIPVLLTSAPQLRVAAFLGVFSLV